MDADAPHGRKERAHRELGKPRRTRFPTAPTASIFLPINHQEEIRCWTRAHRRLSRIRHFSTAVDNQARRAPASDGGPEEEAADASADEPAAAEEPTLPQRQADAIGTVAEAALAGGLDRGTAGDRYQVVLHVDAEALGERPDVPAGTSGGAASESEPRAGGDRVLAGTSAEAASRSEPRAGGDRVPAGTPATSQAASGGPGDGAPIQTEVSGRGGPARRRWRRKTGPCPGVRPTTAAGRQTVLDEAGGIHVSAETARRMACDTATVSMHHGPGGEILDVGRRTRTISPALRRALAARDRHCRFPGCGNLRCDGHHIEHWADGGRTALDNLVLLCRRHHRAVHEEGFRARSTRPGTRGSWGRTASRWRRRRQRRRGRDRRCSPRTTPWQRRASRSTPTRRPRPGAVSDSTSTTR